MAIILTDVIVSEGLATPDQVRAAMAACGGDESRLPSLLAGKGPLVGEKLEALYDLAVCRASEDADGAGAAKVRLRLPPGPPPPPIPAPPELAEALKDPARAFGPYTLIKDIGRGGMGIVYRAWRADQRRVYAVKVLPMELAGEEERARFGREAQTAAKLRHSGIVRVYDSGNIGGRMYFSMDLIDGRSLADLIKKDAVAWRDAAKAMAECAMAVQFAHDHGVVHRDLKPANILIDGKTNRALLLDFGLARNAEDPSLTLTGQVMGTLLYMSPEQIEGRVRDVDARSDVYSLGASLYHAVAGVPPFPFSDFGTFFDQVRSRRPEPPSKKKVGLGPELDAVILRCLEKKPADRYPRAFDFAVDLRRILRQLAPLTAPPPPPARKKSPDIDELTGLPSRRALFREAETGIPWAELPAPVTLALFDVDKIALLNERDGKDATDAKIRKIAALVSDMPGDGSQACRHGGDSFLCILADVDKAGAIAFAEKVRGAVERDLPGVTISAGIAGAPQDGSALQPLVHAANLAISEAKKSGRNKVVAAGRQEADLSTALPCRTMIGRDAEFSQAVGLLDTIRRGQMATMLLEGDPGSGKSRFMSEVAARARTAGLLPIPITCDEAKRSLPGGVLLAVVQEFYAKREASQKALKGKLTKPQRYVFRDAVPCLNHWAPELPAPAVRDFKMHLQQGLEAAIRSMTDEMPILLLLDSAPVSDALSMAVLRELVKDVKIPLGLVLAIKGAFAQLDEKSSDLPLLDLWREAAKHTAKLLRMAPLTLEQVESLVCTVLEGADLPDGFPELIAEASCGNPLYVEAALRGLAAKGKIGREHGGWKVDPATFDDLPPSLDKAVQRLGDGLSPKTAEILSQAAMMGAAIDLDALQAMGNWKEGELLDVLDELEDKGLVKNKGAAKFEFSAGYVRDVRYQAIPAGKVAEMRAKAGVVMIDLYGVAPLDPNATVSAAAPGAGAGARVPLAGEPKAPGTVSLPAPAGTTPLPGARLVTGMDYVRRARIPEAKEALSDAGMEAAMRFVQALTTELKVGRLYPKESKMRVELRERLTESAKELMAAAPRVTFAADPTGAKVNGVALPAAGEGTGQSLMQLFHEKLLSSLTLDRGVTPAEVLSLLDGLTLVFARETAPPDYWDRYLDGRNMSHVDILQRRYIAAEERDFTMEAEATQDKPLIAEEVEVLWTVLQALKASSDNRKLYPAGHKLVEDALRRLNAEAARLLKTAPVVAVSAPENDLVVNGVSVDSRMVRSLTTWLATEFARLEIKSFTLHQGINDREVRALVTVMVCEDGPSAAKAIAANRFAHVVFDARSYERVTENTKVRTQVQEMGTGGTGGPKQTVMVKSKELEIEESAKALMRAPLAKFLSPETEKALSPLFNDLVEAKMQRLMEPIVDRMGTCLRETNEGLRKQAASMVTRTLDLGTPAVREILLRRLETPLATAACSEQDEAALAAVGNAVRAWIASGTALKQHKLMVAFMARICSKPEVLKRVPSMKTAMSMTLMMVGMLATEEAAELISKGDPILREGAGRVAAMIGPSMVHPLVSLILVSSDITVRRIAAGALKEIGDGFRQLASQVKIDAASTALRNVLSVYELAGPGNAELALVMKAAAGHADLGVREQAAALLIRAKSLTTPMLVTEILSKADGALQKGAIMVAKDLKMREVGGQILKIAEKTDDEDILRTACNYFRECPTAEALPLLTRLFSSKTRAFGLLKGMSDPTRVAATEALRRLNLPDAKKMIERALSDGSETVRRAAKPPGSI